MFSIDGAWEDRPVAFIDQNTIGKRKILRNEWYGQKTRETPSANLKLDFEAAILWPVEIATASILRRIFMMVLHPKLS